MKDKNGGLSKRANIIAICRTLVQHSSISENEKFDPCSTLHAIFHRAAFSLYAVSQDLSWRFHASSVLNRARHYIIRSCVLNRTRGWKFLILFTKCVPFFRTLTLRIYRSLWKNYTHRDRLRSIWFNEGGSRRSSNSSMDLNFFNFLIFFFSFSRELKRRLETKRFLIETS